MGQVIAFVLLILFALGIALCGYSIGYLEGKQSTINTFYEIMKVIVSFYSEKAVRALQRGDKVGASAYERIETGVEEMMLCYFATDKSLKYGKENKMEQMKKIVLFSYYCPKCKHMDLKETLDPCNRCLNTPVNDYSRKPTEFEEKENGKSQKGKN